MKCKDCVLAEIPVESNELERDAQEVLFCTEFGQYRCSELQRHCTLFTSPNLIDMEGRN